MQKEHAQEISQETEASPDISVENPSEVNESSAKIAELETTIAELKAQASEAHDKMMRVAADADNFRKRLEKEKADTRLYAIQTFAKDLLPVIDAFDKAMSTLNSTENNLEGEEGQKLSSIVEGVQMVAKVFEETLKKHGIEKLPGKGEPFNPSYHNAIAKVTDPAYDREMIVDEFLSGYKIGDRILRTAMVRVGSPD